MTEFLVTERAMRPASVARECFYCKRKIGETHKDDCVLVHKKVVIQVTIEYAIEVPANWTKEQVEFYRNEGSWCTDNMLAELDELRTAGGCLCSQDLKFKCVSMSDDAYIKES